MKHYFQDQAEGYILSTSFCGITGLVSYQCYCQTFQLLCLFSVTCPESDQGSKHNDEPIIGSRAPRQCYIALRVTSKMSYNSA